MTRLVLREARTSLAVVLAVASALALVANGPSALVLSLWSAGWLVLLSFRVPGPLAARRRVRHLGSHATIRLLLCVGIAGMLVHRELSHELWAWVGLGLLLVLVRGESLLADAARYRGVLVANLSGRTLRERPYVPEAWLYGTLVGAPFALVLAALLEVPGPWSLTIVAVPLLGAVVTVADALVRRRDSRLRRDALRDELEAHAPRFAVYWDVATGPGYQLGMWLPYLDRIGEPYVVVLRTVASFDVTVQMGGSAPVIVARSLTDLENIVVPSLQAVFYVNNAARNTHMVRYSELTHVQLLHGDSDKAPSFNPVTAMYDLVFVAGNAGIERYHAHGVHIEASKFRVVGRPQVEGVARREGAVPRGRRLHVLYAPTWQGYREDSNYSSLGKAEAIVELLLARDVSVTFRPHPFSYDDPASRAVIDKVRARLESDAALSGRAHVTGDAAEKDATIVECFNAADAMVADVSSVVPDFLYSGKPFATTCRVADIDEFIADFPLARASYVLDADVSNGAEVLDMMLGDDPLAATRAALRTHYLGDFPEDAYAETFVRAARAVVHGEDVGPRPVAVDVDVTGEIA